MWLCLSNAFLSIVSKNGNPDQFCVRSRCRVHITNIFPDAEVIEKPGTDYRYRAFINRSEVAKIIGEYIMQINYTNFKDSVKDKELANAYYAVWARMFEYQQTISKSEKSATKQQPSK